MRKSKVLRYQHLKIVGNLEVYIRKRVYSDYSKDGVTSTVKLKISYASGAIFTVLKQKLTGTRSCQK